MAKETEKLLEAFATRDKVDGFLANLEQLKADGATTDEQYITIKGEYEQRLNAANSEIAQIKSKLKKQLETTQRDIETSRWELGRLEAKYKVGELPLEKYQSSDRKLRANIEELEQSSEELNRLIKAENSADIGVLAKKPGIAVPELPSLGKVITLAKQIKLPRGRLLAMTGGGAALIIIVVVILLLTLGGRDDTGLLPEQYKTIDIPVDIVGATNIGSLHFEITYDPAMLLAIEVENGTLADDAMFEYSVEYPGRVIVGIIDSEGISGDGPVTVIAFQIKEEGVIIPLYLENIIAHDAASLAKVLFTPSEGDISAGEGSVTFTAPTLAFSSAGD